MNTILIIDDDAEIRDVLSDLLEMEGYECFSAENGEVGLALLARIKCPSLILLDQNMPVCNGAEFLARLSEDKKFAEIPVIAMSAQRAYAVGPNVKSFLSKPFETAVLVAAIKAHARKCPASEFEQEFA